MARKPLKRRGQRHITETALDAWRRCDYHALHKALGLRPWQRSPLPYEATCLGVSELVTHDQETPWNESWEPAMELQRDLVKLAGWPDVRAAYERKLREAQERVAHAQDLIDHPERGGHGTGDDKASRQLALEKAQANLQWRHELLASPDETCPPPAVHPGTADPQR
jgi:hypothetical protein